MPLFDVTRIITTTIAQRVVRRVRAKDEAEARMRVDKMDDGQFEAKEPAVVLSTHTHFEGVTPRGERYP